MKKVVRGIHGGNIYMAAKEYGIRQEEILDFSANINPLGIPESVRRSIASGIDNLVNYPDPECWELRGGIAEYLGTREENIIIGNGASEIIFLVLDALEVKKVLMPAPTFAEYAKAAESLKVDIRYFEIKEEEDFNLNINRLMESITCDIDAVVLCNPNNPTSKLVAKSDLLKFIGFAKEKNVYVIIDEAFIELTEEGNKNSMVDLLDKNDNVFVIRAFTKLFAIPGLRLGYGIGAREMVRNMWAKKLPWSVNSIACSLGGIFNAEKEYLEKTARWLREEKKRFYEALSEFGQLRVFDPDTNFILVKLRPEPLSSALLKDKLMRKGILIRDAGNFKYLNDKFVRLAVRDRESNERFINALEEVFDNK